MAKILQENPLSNEAQSPLIAGLSEGISKLSEILDMKVSTFTDLQLSNIYISTEDKNRIYEAPDGKRLWLNTPEIVVKKNGTAITQSTGHFSIDYVGGSITFESGYTLNDSDIVTVSASYIIAESKTVDDIKSLLNDTNTLALRYKGFYANESSLTSALPNGVNGEFAFVLSPNFAFYAWDSTSNAWKNTQSIEELSNFYTKTETDNLLKTKEPTITAKGTTSNDDNYYWGGRKAWVDIFTKVRNTALIGLSTATKSVITTKDTVLTALGKLQAQITELSNTKGDMSKSVYDTNLSGVVDNSEKLGGNLPGYYATAAAVQAAQSTANAAKTTADNAVKKSGDVMTGALTLHADPTENMHAATKQYVDNSTGMDLLWQNASPTSTFESQEFKLNGNYKYYLISVRNNVNSAAMHWSIVFADGTYQGVFGFDSFEKYYTGRGVTVTKTDSGASFNFGVATQSAQGVNDNYAIPIKIYGIK